MLTNRVKAVSQRAKSVIRIGAFICVGLVAVGMGPRLAGLSSCGNAYALPGTLPGNPPGGPSECGSPYERTNIRSGAAQCVGRVPTCGNSWIGGCGGSCWDCDFKYITVPILKDAPNSVDPIYFLTVKDRCPGTYVGECFDTDPTWLGRKCECVFKAGIYTPNNCDLYEGGIPAAKCTYTPGGG